MNSFKSVQKAIDYEYKKQIEIIENGTKVEQCTLSWDEKNNRTFSHLENFPIIARRDKKKNLISRFFDRQKKNFFRIRNKFMIFKKSNPPIGFFMNLLRLMSFLMMLQHEFL